MGIHEGLSETPRVRGRIMTIIKCPRPRVRRVGTGVLTNFVGDVGTGTYLTITGVRKQQHCLTTGQNEPTTNNMTATPPLWTENEK